MKQAQFLSKPKAQLAVQSPLKAEVRPRPSSASIVQRAQSNPNSLTPRDVLQLQRVYGNRFVQRLLLQNPSQPAPQKSTAKTMRGQNQPDFVQGGDVSESTETQIQSARGGGHPLPENVRAPMENAFGADFSGVRIHTDSSADTLNRSVQAKAFTTGSDLFFSSGMYQPQSQAGQELLAHELTHVVQQSAEKVQRKFSGKRHGFPFFFDKITIPEIQSVISYIEVVHEEDSQEFQDLVTSTQNHGSLSDWVAKNLDTTLEKIQEWANIYEIKQNFPQTEPIPDEWIKDTKAKTNLEGPPLVVISSPQHTPQFYDEDIDLVDEKSITKNDFVVDLSKGTYNIHSRPYDITPRDRQDVRQSVMLSNSFIDFSGGSLPLQDPKEIKTDVKKQKGNNVGNFKTVREVGDDITKKERERQPQFYENKVIMHEPDVSLTGSPQSQMGFHPGTQNANALMGFASGLGGKYPYKSQIKNFVIREQNNQYYRRTLEGRNERKSREETMRLQYEEIVGYERYDHLRNAPHFIPITERSKQTVFFRLIDSDKMGLENDVNSLTQGMEQDFCIKVIGMLEQIYRGDATVKDLLITYQDQLKFVNQDNPARIVVENYLKGYRRQFSL
jgi:hypothetical protein